MLRVVLTIVLPLALPSAIYFCWLHFAHRLPSEETTVWAAVPWLWLAVAGVLSLALVLFVVTVHFGTSQPGTYVPPRWENGRLVPSHIEPASHP